MSGAARACASDGEHVWVPLAGSNEVAQMQASTGRILGTWTGATGAGGGALVAAGRVFVTSQANGALYAIDPSQPPGPAVLVASLPSTPTSLAFDGARIWSANASTVSIIPLTAAPPYANSTVPAAITAPGGILFDGLDIWVTDRATNRLLRLDASGGIMQSIGVGISPREAVFDGANIWVPNAGDNSISVVAARTGALVTTIKSNPTNRLDAPTSASFDGERILVANTSGNSVSVFRAADLSFVASVDTGAASAPQGTCSDGVSFWVGLGGISKLMRY
jgi:DNA-binding beta-propeller fold protein YncE